MVVKIIVLISIAKNFQQKLFGGKKDQKSGTGTSDDDLLESSVSFDKKTQTFTSRSTSLSDLLEDERPLALLLAAAGRPEFQTIQDICPEGFLLRGRRIPWSKIPGPIPKIVLSHEMKGDPAKAVPVWNDNVALLIGFYRCIKNEKLDPKELANKFSLYPGLPGDLKDMIKDAKQHIISETDPARRGITPEFEKVSLQFKRAIAAQSQMVVEMSRKLKSETEKLDALLIRRDQELLMINPDYTPKKRDAGGLYAHLISNVGVTDADPLAAYLGNMGE